MFDNIGRKIKTLATVICWLGIAASITGGIAVIANGHDLELLGGGIMLAGSLFSWIGSYFIYACGQLVDKTEDISAQLAALREDMKTGVQVKTATEKAEEIKKSQAILGAYHAAFSKMNSAEHSAEFYEAAVMFDEIKDYRDSKELAEKCRTAAGQAAAREQNGNNV